ncbi:DedA family protein [Streptomyces nogalater]
MGAIALICLAAVLGDQAGYMFGKKVGPSLFNRPDSRLFKQENVTKAHEFFEKYGPKSLVLARFVPIVRTFTPIIAGVSGMKYRSFLIFNILGGVLWGRHPARLLARQHRVRQDQHRGDPHPDRPRLGGPDRDRVPARPRQGEEGRPGPAAAPAGAAQQPAYQQPGPEYRQQPR